MPGADAGEGFACRAAIVATHPRSALVSRDREPARRSLADLVFECVPGSADGCVPPCCPMDSMMSAAAAWAAAETSPGRRGASCTRSGFRFADSPDDVRGVLAVHHEDPVPPGEADVLGQYVLAAPAGSVPSCRPMAVMISQALRRLLEYGRSKDRSAMDSRHGLGQVRACVQASCLCATERRWA